MLGGVYVIYDDGRPLVEAYDGPQIVGMDLHRRRSVLVRMAEDGHKLSTARIANSPARLAAEIKRAGLHPKVVLEACYGWYWAADTLTAAGAEVHLAHPLGVKAFSCRRVKNDELDARDLADLLRMGRLAEARGRPAGDPRAPRDHQVPRQAGAAAHQLQGPGPRRAGQARHRGDLPGASSAPGEPGGWTSCRCPSRTAGRSPRCGS
jgi:hypothetical protein